MIFKLTGKLHENLLLRYYICKCLYDLLNFVVESRLGSDVVETFDQLFHDFPTVLLILGTEHAHQVHDAHDEAAVVEVEIFYQTFKNVLVRVEKRITVLLKQLRIPLNDCLLSLA